MWATGAVGSRTRKWSLDWKSSWKSLVTIDPWHRSQRNDAHTRLLWNDLRSGCGGVETKEARQANWWVQQRMTWWERKVRRVGAHRVDRRAQLGDLSSVWMSCGDCKGASGGMSGTRWGGDGRVQSWLCCEGQRWPAVVGTRCLLPRYLLVEERYTFLYLVYLRVARRNEQFPLVWFL
jgi:hypothetical protein